MPTSVEQIKAKQRMVITQFCDRARSPKPTVGFFSTFSDDQWTEELRKNKAFLAHVKTLDHWTSEELAEITAEIGNLIDGVA